MTKNQGKEKPMYKKMLTGFAAFVVVGGFVSGCGTENRSPKSVDPTLAEKSVKDFSPEKHAGEIQEKADSGKDGSTGSDDKKRKKTSDGSAKKAVNKIGEATTCLHKRGPFKKKSKNRSVKIIEAEKPPSKNDLVSMEKTLSSACSGKEIEFLLAISDPIRDIFCQGDPSKLGELLISLETKAMRLVELLGLSPTVRPCEPLSQMIDFFFGDEEPELETMNPELEFAPDGPGS